MLNLFEKNQVIVLVKVLNLVSVVCEIHTLALGAILGLFCSLIQTQDHNSELITANLTDLVT